MAACEYCGVRRAVNLDHVIPKSLFRLRFTGRKARLRGKVDPIWKDLTVDACFECNTAKAARKLIPPSLAHRLSELNDLGIGTFRVWDGSPEALREVVK